MRVFIFLLLISTSLQAQETRQYLEANIAVDGEDGRTTGLRWGYSGERGGLSLFGSTGEFDQLALAEDGSDVNVTSDATDLGIDGYLLFGAWELGLAYSQGRIDDGTESDRFSLRLGYQGERWNLSATASSLELLTTIAIEQTFRQFSRVVSREEERDGTSFALDGSVMLSERVDLFGGARTQRFDDPLNTESRFRVVTNTPLNETQRVSAWSAYAGLSWYLERVSLSAQYGIDSAEDFDDETETFLVSVDIPFGARWSTAVVAGSTRSDIFDATQFSELSLRYRF